MLNISYQGSFLYCPHKMGQFSFIYYNDRFTPQRHTFKFFLVSNFE